MEPHVMVCECGHALDQHDGDGGECSYELWDDGQWLEEDCDCREFREPVPSTNGQPLVLPVNHGALTVEVWPTYMGLGESTDGVTLVEQLGHRDYERGQIWWETKDGDVVGHARVLLPKGVYTHLIFCHGPVEMICAVDQLEQPVVFDRPGFFDVDPIINKDYVPRR